MRATTNTFAPSSLGAGCNHLTVYVELLIDGVPSMRETGSCNERMRKVTWNVAVFKYRSAQVRIVDAGAGAWDHINVDHFAFGWEVEGGVLADNGEMKKRGGVHEQAKSGAAYAFTLKEGGGSANYCANKGDMGGCVWEEEQKFVASDKRR